jgi:hypothetical protein
MQWPATIAAHNDLPWSIGNHCMASLLRPNTMILIRASHDSQWTLGGRLEVSHMYLSKHRLLLRRHSRERGPWNWWIGCVTELELERRMS